MSAAMVDAARLASVAGLRECGFQGFHSVSHLRQSQCMEIPVERGVYVVVRDTDAPPEFLTRSVAGRFRQKDPTMQVENLAASWVEGARVLCIGRAPGPGVRSLLQQRIKRQIRFGQGKAVAAAGGRLLWQLRDHVALQFAWRVTADDDPAPIETELLDAFVASHGRPPFANEERPR